MKVILQVLCSAAIFASAMCAPSPSVDSPSPSVERVRPHHTIDFNSYWSVERIHTYMRELEANFSTIAEVEQMGRTHEGVDVSLNGI